MNISELSYSILQHQYLSKITVNQVYLFAEKEGIHSVIKVESCSSGSKSFSDPSGKFTVVEVSNTHIHVKHADPNTSCTFIAPNQIFSSIHDKRVSCMDVSKGGLGVSISNENELIIWDSASGSIRRVLEGHVGEIYACKFFPSGLVILSGSADFQAKIWSAETGTCPATLVGHRGAITDLAIVDKGKNVVTVSKDGTARLWHCGSRKCISLLYEHDSAINCCLVSDIDPRIIDLKDSDQVHGAVIADDDDDLQINCDGKILAIGTEDCMFKVFSLKTGTELICCKLDAAISACSMYSESEIICGTQDGTVTIINLRQPNSHKIVLNFSGSPVLSFLKFKGGFFISRGDGICSYHTLDSDKVIQLTGPDCDSVYKLASDGRFVYSCCQDGKIRKYNVSGFI